MKSHLGAGSVWGIPVRGGALSLSHADIGSVLSSGAGLARTVSGIAKPVVQAAGSAVALAAVGFAALLMAAIMGSKPSRGAPAARVSLGSLCHIRNYKKTFYGICLEEVIGVICDGHAMIVPIENVRAIVRIQQNRPGDICKFCDLEECVEDLDEYEEWDDEEFAGICIKEPMYHTGKPEKTYEGIMLLLSPLIFVGIGVFMIIFGFWSIVLGPLLILGVIVFVKVWQEGVAFLGSMMPSFLRAFSGRFYPVDPNYPCALVMVDNSCYAVDAFINPYLAFATTTGERVVDVREGTISGATVGDVHALTRRLNLLLDRQHDAVVSLIGTKEFEKYFKLIA